MSARGPVLVNDDARIDRLERARALVPTLAARAARTAEDRRVPDETIADFRAAGLFRILQPSRFGGSELDFTLFSAITRELARGCASSAWVYAVIEEMSWVIAMFPEAAQVEIWGGEPQALACAALMPAGLAQRDGEGFRLSGQWHVPVVDHVELGAPNQEIAQLTPAHAVVAWCREKHPCGVVDAAQEAAGSMPARLPTNSRRCSRSSPNAPRR